MKQEKALPKAGIWLLKALFLVVTVSVPLAFASSTPVLAEDDTTSSISPTPNIAIPTGISDAVNSFVQGQVSLAEQASDTVQNMSVPPSEPTFEPVSIDISTILSPTEYTAKQNNLEVRVSSSPEQLVSGQSTTVKVVITNLGTTDLSNLTLKNPLSASLSFDKNFVTTLGSVNYDANTNSVNGSISSLKAGESVTINYQLIASVTDGSEGKAISNAISVTGGGLSSPTTAKLKLIVGASGSDRGVITPGLGATITSSRIRLDIPANALPGSGVITIKPKANTSDKVFDKNNPGIMSEFELEYLSDSGVETSSILSQQIIADAVSGLDPPSDVLTTEQSLTKQSASFSSPYKLTFDFNDLADVTNLDYGFTPVVAVYDEEHDTWVRQPNLNTDGNTVSVTPNHFSTWGAGIYGTYPDNGASMSMSSDGNSNAFNGQLSYGYPLWTPSGRGGMSPSLALSYSTGSIDGILGNIQAPWTGMGWNLSNSEISRLILDGGCGTSCGSGSYGYEDRYSLNLNGSSYELLEDRQHPGRYFTANASFMYIQRHNAYLGNERDPDNNLPNNTTGEWWEIVESNGTRYRLGWNQDSEQLAPEVGYTATSSGILNNNPILTRALKGWADYGVYSPSVIDNGDGTRLMWYNGKPSGGGNHRIGMAGGTGTQAWDTIAAQNPDLFEAEGGLFTNPMQIDTNDDVSGCQYIQVPTGGGDNIGQVDITFTVLSDGTYNVFGNAKGGTNANKLNVQVDGGTTSTWLLPSTSTFAWDQVGTTTTGGNLSYALSAGTHTFSVKGNLDGTQLDSLYFSTSATPVLPQVGCKSTPVIDIGASGAWDDEHVGGVEVVKVGSTYHMWYVGSGDGSVWAVGHATSTDSLHWTKDAANPVLTKGTTGAFDATSLDQASVTYDSGTYKMWYTGKNGTAYKIGSAHSSDGSSWTKDYGASNATNLTGFSYTSWETNIFFPNVVKSGSTYYMFYTGLSGSTYKIGVASSTDGIAWTTSGTNPIINTSDASWMNSIAMAPSVTYDGTTWRMWFSTGSTAAISYASNTQSSPMTKSEWSYWGNTAVNAWEGLGFAGTGTNVVAGKWKVDKATNTHDDTMTYSYSEESRTANGATYDKASYPDSVLYTGKDGLPCSTADGDSCYKVKFVTVGRAAGIDNVPDSPKNWDTWDDKVLDSIEIRALSPDDPTDQVLRSYRFNYSDHNYSGNSTSWDAISLDSIDSSSSAGLYLPRTTFNYTDKPARASQSGYTNWDYPRLTNIFNGTGGSTNYTFADDARPYTQYFAYKVTASTTKDGVTSNDMVTNFDYGTPCYIHYTYGRCNTNNKGNLLGFADSTTKSMSSGSVVKQTKHFFSVTSKTEGTEYQTDTMDSTGTVFGRSTTVNGTFDWSNTAYLPDGVRFVYPQTTKSYERQGTSLVELSRTDNTFDPQWGELVTTKIASGAAETFYGRTDYTYLSNINYSTPSVTFLHSYPQTTTSCLFDEDPATCATNKHIVGKNFIGYDDSVSSIDTKAEVTLSQALTLEEYDLNPAQSATKTADSMSTYDTWGNITATCTKGIKGILGTAPSACSPTITDWQKSSTYDSYYHQYLKTTTIADPDGSGSIRSMTSTTVYDFEKGEIPLGLVREFYSPNADTGNSLTASRVIYDTLGRSLETYPPTATIAASKAVYPSFSYASGGTSHIISAPYTMLSMIYDDNGMGGSQYRSSWGYFDGLGRTIASLSPSGNGKYLRTDASYDNRGFVGKASVPYEVPIFYDWISGSTVYGSGSDGACTTSSTTNINTGTCVGRGNADAVNFRVTANTSSGQNQITVSTTPTGLANNDEVLIIDLTTGTYETKKINSIATNTLTLNANLTYVYNGTTNKIMVQRIPQYSNVTVSSGGNITISAFDGNKNGIVFFRASGTVTINSGGKIDVTGLGYTAGTGGAGGAESAGAVACNGDGNVHGGGASHDGVAGVAGSGPNGGLSAGTTAGSGDEGGGGGGGGNAWTPIIGTSGANGDMGGVGGASVSASIDSQLFMGGGGAGGSGGASGGGGKISGNCDGAGDGTHGGAGGNGGNGGAGAGAISIYAQNIVNSGEINANGLSGSAGSNGSNGEGHSGSTGHYGAGGGGSGAGGGSGSGGSIVLIADNLTSGTINKSGGAATSNAAATGGNGGVGGGNVYGGSGGGRGGNGASGPGGSGADAPDSPDATGGAGSDGVLYTAKPVLPIAYTAPNWASLKYSTSVHDSFGRITSTTSPAGITSYTSYDGRVTSSIDPMGHKSISYSNELGQLLHTDVYTGTTPNFNLYKTTSYGYDTIGHVVKISDSANIGTTNDYGTGADGAVSSSGFYNCQTSHLISGRTQPDCFMTAITATANVSATSLTVASYTGLAANDEILIIQMTGANAGTYETKTISSVSGGTTINFSGGLVYGYQNSGAQVIRIPQFTNLTVGGEMYVSDWNGVVGGVLVFKANGTLTINNDSSINVVGSGFSGGSSVSGPSGGSAVTCAASQNLSGVDGINGNAGQSGSGIMAGLAPSLTAKAIKGIGSSTINGGGGGGASGSGGAGGSHFTVGSDGTVGANGGAGGTTNGGAGGATGIAGIASGSATFTNKIILGGGGASGATGSSGASGACSTASSTSVTSGAGGNGGASGVGGAGGGILMVFGKNIVNNGNMMADGLDGVSGSLGTDGGFGVNVSGTNQRVAAGGGAGGRGGAGGGGAGGSLLIYSDSSSFGVISASGGTGASNSMNYMNGGGCYKGGTGSRTVGGGGGGGNSGAGGSTTCDTAGVAASSTNSGAGGSGGEGVVLINQTPNAISYTYNHQGQKISQVDPDLGTWIYTYDALGRADTQTDSLGNVTKLYYDRLNRLARAATGVDISNLKTQLANWFDYTGNGNKGLGSISGSTTYDVDGNLLASSSATINLLGQATQSVSKVNTDGNTTYDYTFTTNTTYDSAGRARTSQLPNPGGDDNGSFSQEILTPIYSARGIMQSISGYSSSLGTTSYITDTVFNTFGQGELTTLGNGVQIDPTYDTNTFRLSSMRIGKPNPTSPLINNSSYTYDNIGNITAFTDSVRSENHAYTYDDLGRLTKATVNTNADVRDYTYNNIGNMTSYKLNEGSVQNYSYPEAGQARPHAATAYGSNSYVYDANGNMTSRTSGGTTYCQTWDANRQLQKVERLTSGACASSPVVAETTTNVYSGGGVRVMRKDGNDTYLNFAGMQIKLVSGVWNSATVYYPVAGAFRVYTGAGNNLYYRHTDNLGSTNIISDSSGIATGSASLYAPFGEMRVGSLDSKTDFGYTGQTLDRTTGTTDDNSLIYYGARYYLPELHRFISADTVLDGLNRYSYVGNNPIMNTDSTGHSIDRSGDGPWYPRNPGCGTGNTVNCQGQPDQQVYLTEQECINNPGSANCRNGVRLNKPKVPVADVSGCNSDATCNGNKPYAEMGCDRTDPQSKCYPKPPFNECHLFTAGVLCGNDVADNKPYNIFNSETFQVYVAVSDWCMNNFTTCKSVYGEDFAYTMAERASNMSKDGFDVDTLLIGGSMLPLEDRIYASLLARKADVERYYGKTVPNSTLKKWAKEAAAEVKTIEGRQAEGGPRVRGGDGGEEISPNYDLPGGKAKPGFQHPDSSRPGTSGRPFNPFDPTTWPRRDSGNTE